MFKDYVKLLEEKTGKSIGELLTLPTEEFKKILTDVLNNINGEDLEKIAKNNGSLLMDNIPVGATVTITREKDGIKVEGNTKGSIAVLIEMISIALGNMINNIDGKDLKNGVDLKEAKKDTLECALTTIRMNVEEID